ncbi:MAG: RNA methyltransferase [Ilumatobacteraceae bacterium]
MAWQLGFKDPAVQRLRRLLGRRSARWDEGAFVVEGTILVEEVVAAGWHIEAQFVSPGADPVPGSDAVVHELAPHVMERVASTEAPQPVMAVVRMRDQRVSDLTSKPLVVVCDRISDPGNLGTILRSCEAAGVDGVVLVTGSVDPYNPKVVRASAGALFHVPVIADVALHELQALHLPLLGTSSHTGTPFTTVDLASPFALVMGSEAHGVDPQLPIDSWLTIPHVGRAESLNVAMATTVVVFEAARQRGLH